MLTENMVAAYLDLLGCADARSVSRENLFRLQQAHLATIPYTNLTIFLFDQVPALDTASLFDKIVVRRQGGYCFELNGLFAELLRTLGYGVTEYFARWHFGESDPVPMRRHRVLKVTCPEGTFLADAGVGCLCPTTPLKFEFDTPMERIGLRYRLIRDPQLGIVVQTELPEGFVNYFSFTEDPHFPQDFVYVNYHCSREPSSMFRSKLMVHRLTESHQYRVEPPEEPGTSGSLIVRDNQSGVSERTLIPDKTALQQVLSETFGIVCLLDDLPD